MNVRETLDTENGWDELFDCIKGDLADCTLKCGLEFKWIEDPERDDELMIYVFSLNGQPYQAFGEYSSWDSPYFEMSDLKQMTPVKKVTKTIEVWEAI